MAFATIPAWSTTAGTNTEIDGISLAENVMVPSAVNNAFREMMSQVAEFTRRGSDLASASTLDLDSIDTMFLDITGTTTVTAVTLTDGHSRRARATGAFQITASATLVVNGSTSVNYTTTAGDLLFFEGYSASTVRVWTVTGGGSTTASTTEVLTGTNAAKSVTPDSLAALWEKGSDVASSGTISLGEGGFFHITGTTTITDIDFATAKDGRGAWLEFDGALTLTHNATTLNLPGAANITTAAGDRAYVVQDSTDNVHVLAYQRAASFGSAFTKSYTSSDQTITAAGSLTLAHGLGAAPTLIQLRLKCTTGEHGYSINDEVIINPHEQDPAGTSSRGVAIVVDATNLNLRFGSTAGTFGLLHKTTGVGAVITNGSWALIVKAWA